MRKTKTLPKRLLFEKKKTKIGGMESIGDGESEREAASPKLEEEKSASPAEGSAKPATRFIPEHKRPDAALTFPEKVRRRDDRTYVASFTFWYLTLTMRSLYLAHEFDEVCRQASHRHFLLLVAARWKVLCHK